MTNPPPARAAVSFSPSSSEAADAAAKTSVVSAIRASMLAANRMTIAAKLVMMKQFATNPIYGLCLLS
jgi:hypothetical protein